MTIDWAAALRPFPLLGQETSHGSCPSPDQVIPTSQLNHNWKSGVRLVAKKNALHLAIALSTNVRTRAKSSWLNIRPRSLITHPNLLISKHKKKLLLGSSSEQSAREY